MSGAPVTANRVPPGSQVSASIISNANFGLFTPPGGGVPGPASNITESLVSEILTGWQTSEARDFINKLAGSRRAFAHAQIYPGVGNLKVVAREASAMNAMAAVFAL